MLLASFLAGLRLCSLSSHCRCCPIARENRGFRRRGEVSSLRSEIESGSRPDVGLQIDAG